MKKKGYVLIYSVIAMMLACTLVISTVTIVLYYGKNIGRTIGGNGALYAADSGIDCVENYLNAYYIDKGNIKTNAKDLWETIDVIIGEIVPITGSGQDTKAVLLVQGYMNYNYIISEADLTKALSADEKLNGSYKVFFAQDKRSEIRSKGKLTLLSMGEYVYQNKSYYKFITVEVLIEPVYEGGMITSLKLKTLDYSETIKGGSTLWGNVSW